MVTKSKSKVSKVKRNNKKRTKLIRQGVIKKKTNKPVKRHEVQKVQNKRSASPEPEESEDDGENMLDMVEREDIDFLKNAITNKSYTILNKVKYSGSTNKNKRQKLEDEDESLEQVYEEQIDAPVKVKNLLPIKTNEGIVTRAIEDDLDEEEQQYEEKAADTKLEQPQEGDEESTDEEQFALADDTEINPDVPVTTAHLLAKRNELLEKRKLYIGVLSAGVLENPEEKIMNIKTLLDIMEENSPIYLTVRKLVVVSLVEVFKDLLPSYQIKHQQNTDVKLKKETLKLQKYETNLLQFYKKFLQKLEKYCNIIVKRRNGFRNPSQEEKKLGELSVNALCDLLVTHPYFNFGDNIAQAVVPFLNHGDRNVRETVKSACKTLFKNDKRSEITLKVLRIINHYLKKHSHNVNTDMLEVLLVLKLNDVNLDQNKEDDIKQKKFLARKQKIMQMSRKERKRKKRLEELEKEMLETKAEENRKVKMQHLTEMTKIVFGIYFRILKNSSNTRVLGVCLEGLAKFAHCINMEYYIDLVNHLDNLLKEDWLGYSEKLHCIQTVFTILSGQGEALNLDPSRFYVALYKDLLFTDVLKNPKIFSILLETLNSALIKRRKKITKKRMIAFVKRITTLCLQLPHNSSLSCLGLIKVIMQLNSSVDVLLDMDASVGEGKFDPELDDPEYCNASSTALFELTLLCKHYHPLVCKYARHIASGVPSSGEGSLPAQYGKCTPEQLYTDFDPSEMAFNPPVPLPKKVQPKGTADTRIFADSSFQQYCEGAVKERMKNAKSFFVE